MVTLEDRAARADWDAFRARRALEDAILDGAENGLSQRQISARVGRSQPEVKRLLDRARSRSSRGWPTAAEYAAAVGDELAAGDEDFALRLVVGALGVFRQLDVDATGTFLAERPHTGSHRWDVLYRAAMGWVARERGIPAPSWTRPPALATWWFVRPEPALAGRAMQRTPVELALVGVWIDAESLRGL